MAKKKFNKSKSGIPLEMEEKILAMNPTDLAVETTFERNAIETLKNEQKSDDKISEISDKIKDLKERKKTEEAERDQSLKVKLAQEALDKAKEDETTDEQIKIENQIVEEKENLKAVRSSIADDIRDRSKLLKFMQKTLRRHIESGALKRKK